MSKRLVLTSGEKRQPAPCAIADSFKYSPGPLATRGCEELTQLNKKMSAAVVAIVAVAVVAAVVSYALFINDDEPFSGTVVFQSNVVGVTATMTCPDEMVRTGVIGESGELTFTDLPEGDYWYVCAKDGYSTTCGSGSVIRGVMDGRTTFVVNMDTYPAHLPLYISANPSAVVITQGSSGTVTVTVASLLDFSGEGSMDCAQLPSGVTSAFSPAAVTLVASGEASSTLTLTVGSTAPKGSYFVELVCSTEQHINMQLALLLQIS